MVVWNTSNQNSGEGFGFWVRDRSAFRRPTQFEARLYLSWPESLREFEGAVSVLAHG